MRGKWRKAQDVPKTWEGHRAWKWSWFGSRQPLLCYVPDNFSRDPKHCEGIWFRLLDTPAPPPLRRGV